MPAPKGNTNAQKNPDEKADTFLHIRCTRQDKSRWVRAAKGGKLAQWVIKNLNQAADIQEIRDKN